MAPHHLYEGLVFCRQWVRIPIPNEDCVLASFNAMPKPHEDEQKAALVIQPWRHRLDIATQPPPTRLRLGVQDSLRLAVSSLQMAHAGRARPQQVKGTDRMQVWHISTGEDKTPFFISTPTHAVPQEPRSEWLREGLDTLFGAEPPVFLPRLLAHKDGRAEVDKGKCTHTPLHTITRANLHLHPLSLSDMAAEVVSRHDQRDSSGNWRRTAKAQEVLIREAEVQRRDQDNHPGCAELPLHPLPKKPSLVWLRLQHHGVQTASSRQCQWTQRSHPTAPGAAQASR